MRLAFMRVELSVRHSNDFFIDLLIKFRIYSFLLQLFFCLSHNVISCLSDCMELLQSQRLDLFWNHTK